MADAILYDTRNLALTEGTGIATYSKELVRSAAQLGYRPEALIAIRGRARRNDPLRTALQIEDVATRTAADHLSGAVTWAVGRPFGLPADELDLNPNHPVRQRFSQFDRLLGASRIFDTAYNHFARYSKRLAVKVADPPKIFHATSPMPARVVGSANVYTIHDLVPILFPSMTTDNKEVFLGMLREIARTADHIVTVSEHSRADIIHHLGVEEDRVTNTYQCVDDLGIQQSLDKNATSAMFDCLESYGLEHQQYFIFVGTIEPKKNLSTLIEAYARARSRFPLIIVGSDGWLCDEDNRRIRDERFVRYRLVDEEFVPRRLVRRLPYLPRSDVISLMRGARALLFPSLYEGFGLPVLEAMQLGLPVLTSNVASLKEVAGDAAILVNPRDPNDIARGITLLDADRDLRATLVHQGLEQAKKFTPAKYNERVATVYSAVC